MYKQVLQYTIREKAVYGMNFDTDDIDLKLKIQ